MTSSWTIPRKPIPSGSRYAALSTTNTDQNETSPSSSHTETSRENRDSDNPVSAGIENIGAQRHRPTRSNDENEYTVSQQAMGRLMPVYANKSLNEDDELPSDTQPEQGEYMRVSPWLKTSVLILFGLLIVMLIVALVLLYHFTKQDRGFSIDLGRSVNPYSWRYGPVAFFTIVTAVWHQIDYRCKVAAPYLHMQHGPTLGHKGMLLDYVSPWLPNGLFLAVSNRDWRVLASGIAYGLFKLVILLSTGLLAVQSTIFTSGNQSLDLVWSLGRTEFNGTFYPGPVDTYWGVVAAGLQYARGTNDIAAFQTFSKDMKYLPNATVSAEVEAFFPSLKCDEAQSENVAINFYRSWIDDCSTANYSTTFCESGQSTCTNIAGRDLAGDSELTVSALAFAFVCGGSPNSGEENSTDIRYFLGLMEAQNVTATGPASAHVLTSLICRPDYNVEKAKLDLDTTEPITAQSYNLSNPLTTSGNKAEGVSSSKLTYLVSTLLDSAAAIVPDPSWATVQQADYFFSLMLATENRTDLRFFADPDQMAKTGQTVYRGLAVQVANQWLSPNMSLTTIGTITFLQQRLFVQLSSLWAICVLLALTTICICVVILTDRKVWAHTAFGSHSWNLYIICMNDVLREYMKGFEMSSEDTIQDEVSTVMFQSKVQSGCVPAIEICDYGQQPKTNVRESTIKYWRPIGVRKSFIAITITLLITLIVVLEVVQRKSRPDGFTTVKISLTTAHALSTYIPAAILLSTATILGFLEFAVKVMAPFQYRRTPSMQADASIAFSAFHLTPVVLYESLRKRKYAVFLATCCGLLASFFTIISAGLYTIDYVLHTVETSFSTVGSFNLSQDLAGSLETDLKVSLLEYYNATYPAGTFGDLVYPDIKFNSSDVQVQSLLNQTRSSLVVETNVLRPSLECTAVVSSQLNVSEDTSSDLVNVITIGDIPEQCRKERLGVVTQFRTGGGASESAFRIKSNSTQYGGTFIWIDPYNGSDSEWGSYNSYYADGCQSLGFTWGSWSNSSIDASNFYMYICSQSVQTVPASLTFSIPDMSLNLNVPPILDETKARTVSPYQFPTGFLATYGLDAPFDCDLDSTDPIFGAVICGSKSNFTKADLGNPAKQQEILKAATYVYGLLVAQSMNSFMRTDGDPTAIGLAKQVTATIQDARTLRIFQNNTSKIILQAILAAAIICFVFSFLLTNTKLLPHSPMTLAGSMSILAGSQFSEYVKDKTESFEEFENRLQRK